MVNDTKPLFLKTGKAALEAFNIAEAMTEVVRNDIRRFCIAPIHIGKPFNIIFLDGKLEEDGLLSNPMFWEYTVFHNGKWQNFVKPEDGEGADPIAADGNIPMLVQLFSILNLTPYIKSDGSKASLHRQLFVCPRTVMKRLAVLAKKHGGIAGCIFEVTRTSGRGSRVGDVFDFVQKLPTEELLAQFGQGLSKPFDYNEVIQYRNVAELLRLGFGHGRSI